MKDGSSEDITTERGKGKQGKERGKGKQGKGKREGKEVKGERARERQ